ncbi:MAG: hypothetical protein ACRCWQ_02835 [Bacilli bacterium]
MAEAINQSFNHETNVVINHVRLMQDSLGIDITQLFDKFTIREDIEKGFIEGEVTFLDSILSSKDAFVGIEKVEISFTTADDNFQLFDAYEKIFRVTRYETSLQEQTGTVRAIRLHFRSEPSVKNDSIKLMRSYNNVSNSAFVNLCCDLLEVDMPRNIEETLHAKNFIAPNVTPLDMIDWVKMTSQSKETNGSDFYFFENKDGINFKCIETMKIVEPKHTLTYKPHIDNYNYNIIKLFDKPKGFDIQDDIRHGGIGCTVYTHDLITKRYNSVTLDPRTLPTMNSVEARGTGYESSPTAFTQFWPHNNAYATMDVNSSVHSALSRSVNKTLMNFKAINVEIAGNVDIKTGDVVDVLMPGFDGSDRIDESGKWFVKKLRHGVSRSQIITQLELISDSNVERLETNVESENIEEK